MSGSGAPLTPLPLPLPAFSAIVLSPIVLALDLGRHVDDHRLELEAVVLIRDVALDGLDQRRLIGRDDLLVATRLEALILPRHLGRERSTRGAFLYEFVRS